ncbi:MAG TPA: hypothetical protein VKA54_13230 [Gemmatimonadaceae bacterium]|nr:hypothetical protein [Gemmatimonadaceae bacterium]
MSETHTFPRRDEPQPAPVAQWVGLFLAPAAFAAHLQINYVLVRWACLRSADIWVHVVDVAAIALAALGTVVAWRVWTRAGRDHPGEEGGALPRTRLLGVLGVGFSAMMTLVLIGQWVAAFFISTCQ